MFIYHLRCVYLYLYIALLIFKNTSYEKSTFYNFHGRFLL